MPRNVVGGQRRRHWALGEFKGQVQVPGMVDWPLSVQIELEGERICITAAGTEIGNWALDEVDIINRDGGFEIAVGGESMLVSTENDGEFALEFGMRRAIPNIGNTKRDISATPEGLAEPRGGIDTDEIAAEFRNRLRGQDHRDAGNSSLRIGFGRGRHERRPGRHLR